jgi:hypothetical protein
LEYRITAKENGTDFIATKFDVSTAFNDGTYQVTNLSGKTSFAIFIYGEPSVKTHSISETNSSNEAAVTGQAIIYQVLPNIVLLMARCTLPSLKIISLKAPFRVPHKNQQIQMCR